MTRKLKYWNILSNKLENNSKINFKLISNIMENMVTSDDKMVGSEFAMKIYKFMNSKNSGKIM